MYRVHPETNATQHSYQSARARSPMIHTTGPPREGRTDDSDMKPQDTHASASEHSRRDIARETRRTKTTMSHVII